MIENKKKETVFDKKILFFLCTNKVFGVGQATKGLTNQKKNLEENFLSSSGKMMHKNFELVFVIEKKGMFLIYSMIFFCNCYEDK